MFLGVFLGVHRHRLPPLELPGLPKVSVTHRIVGIDAVMFKGTLLLAVATRTGVALFRRVATGPSAGAKAMEALGTSSHSYSLVHVRVFEGERGLTVCHACKAAFTCCCCSVAVVDAGERPRVCELFGRARRPARAAVHAGSVRRRQASAV